MLHRANNLLLENPNFWQTYFTDPSLPLIQKSANSCWSGSSEENLNFIIAKNGFLKQSNPFEQTKNILLMNSGEKKKFNPQVPYTYRVTQKKWDVFWWFFLSLLIITFWYPPRTLAERDRSQPIIAFLIFLIFFPGKLA